METPFAGNRNVPDPDGAQRRPTHRMVTQTRTNAGRIVAVSPFRCRLWELHDRLQDYVIEESCKADIDRELCNARADDPRPWASATRRSGLRCRVRESWGLDLHRLWSNASIRPAVGQRARALAERVPRLPAHEVYQRLLTCPDTIARSRRKHRDEVVLSARGTPLFRIRYQRTVIALLLPAETVSGNSLKQIRSVLT